MSTEAIAVEQLQALDVARQLAAVGVPLFLATPDPAAATGFRLPRNWQQTRADPAVVDAWRPGMALCMVMGNGLDLLDVDPRSGGDVSALNGSTPASYGVASTPSGGMHSFIRSLGVRSRDSVLPGIDVKAGDATGKGRGFAFIAPTVRISKVSGQPAPYRWIRPPDPARLTAVLRGEIADDTGAALRQLIAEARGPQKAPVVPPELVLKGVPIGSQDVELSRLVMKLRADGFTREAAYAVWSTAVENSPSDPAHPWTEVDFVRHWSGADRKVSASVAREAEAWAALGVDVEQAAAAAPPPGAGPPADPSQNGDPDPEPTQPEDYFGPGGIQALSLAADVLRFGHLRTGRDDLMWSYADGVWRSDKHVVRNRLTRLLGQRFRTNYVGTVEAVVRANVGQIGCDPIPDLINFRNGLLQWRTGELRPHTPAVLSTVQLSVDYDPEAQCPAFEDFVHQVVAPDVVETIWELIGYLMYSGNPLHKAVMLTGKGRNGKGTFLHVVEQLLGPRNVTNASLDDLVNTRFTTASLFGKLANIAGDIDAKYMENTATFKGITGGDTISAEHKGRDRFDFRPWAVPVFSANKIPASADTTVGYLSRWLVVNFPNSFVGREDRRLEGRLTRPEELRGIAARGVAALGTLLDRGGFAETASGRAALEEFTRRVDQVRTWLSDCCDIHPEHPFVARTELYNAYKQWAFRDGHKPVRASEFYDRLEEAGGEPTTIHGTRGFKRIKVLDNGLGTPSAPAPWPLQPVPAPTTGVPEADPAPIAAPAVSAGQAASFCFQGAEGADTPQPPYARDAQVGGLGPPAPSAPTADEPQPIEVAKTRKAQTETAREKRAAAAEERRRAAIAAAAGERFELPAVVTRTGQVLEVDAAKADQLLSTITDELTVDVETTGFDPGHRHYGLRTVQLGNEQFALVLDPVDHADVVRRHLARVPVLHAHAATADLIPLELAGLLQHGLEEAWSRMHDTVTLAKLADPSSTKSAEGLKKLAPAVLGDAAVSPAAEEARSALFKAGKWLTDTKPMTALERSGWAQVDSRCETMIRYAASDVLDDAAIARRLDYPAPNVWRREVLAQTMTARVAHTGLALDAEQVIRLQGEQRAALADATERLAAFGVDNPGSDQQVAAAVEGLGLQLPRTKTGRPSVAKGVLEPHALAAGPLGDLVRARLDYQVAENRLGLFLDGYRAAVEQGDGRVRPTVYTMEAKTGRMSCVRPNLQQVPRAGGFRACITADPGHVLISADFAQVELRVAAALSQDQNLIAILDDPERDIHREIAQIVWGPGAGKAERYQAKRKVFGRIYGSGINGLVTADPPVSEAIARSIVHAMDQMTPGLTTWSRRVSQAVEAGHTTFPSHSGRIIHMPTDRAYAAPNYCIQGTARELLIDALERWSRTRWGACPLLPVHDELVVHVPENDAEEATAALVECMASEISGVRIVAEASEPSFYWKDSE